MTREKRPEAESHGFTLVEFLVATFALVIITGGIVSTLYQSQSSYTTQHNLIEATESGRICLNQITSFLRQAGNDPTGIGFAPIQIVNTREIVIFSDVTGSVPPPAPSTDPLEATGDANGVLNNLYEQVGIRYNPTDDMVFINFGNGWQLLAEQIVDFQLTFYEGDGVTLTTTVADIVKVHVKLIAETNNTSGNNQTITLESDVMLRSRAFQVIA